MSDSVSPTVATASAPRCATTKTSTTAKTLSITISSTIGTARTRMARPIGPSVKSRPCAPRNPSAIADQKPPSRVSFAIGVTSAEVPMRAPF
jgi:hypothetical protein